MVVVGSGGVMLIICYFISLISFANYRYNTDNVSFMKYLAFLAELINVWYVSKTRWVKGDDMG